MLYACGGNKTQNNASEESATETLAEATSDETTVTADEGQTLLWGFVSIGDDKLDAIGECDREEFLMEVLSPGENVEVNSEEWITAHCTAEMKQFLRNQYDYDGEGYATWLMEGRFAGEGEYDTEVTGFGYGLRRGKPVYAIDKRSAFDGETRFVRKGDGFIITSFEINLEPNDPTVSSFAE